MTDSGERFYSQFGEDRGLDQYFGGRQHGCCVEVGALDGVEFSNTLFFEERGWDCLLVEPIPELAERCRLARPRARVVNCAVVAPGTAPEVAFEVAEDIPALSSRALDKHNRAALQRYYGRTRLRRVSVPARSLDDVLTEFGRQPLDFVTIDVEGQERDVLRGFTLSRWNPRVVIVEHNGRFPDPWAIGYFARRGYALTNRTGVNYWYVAKTISGIRQAASYWFSITWRYFLASAWRSRTDPA